MTSLAFRLLCLVPLLVHAQPNLPAEPLFPNDLTERRGPPPPPNAEVAPPPPANTKSPPATPPTLESEPEPTATIGDTSYNTQELHVMERLLTLPPEKLAEMRQAIERIEAMSDAEKAELLAQIREIRQMQAPERRKIMERMRMESPEEREIIRRYWMSLSRDDAMALRQKIRTMTPEARQAFREKILNEARNKE